MKIDNFFSELKRRNVLKVALVYAVLSWLLFELAWILLPTFEAPEWVLPAVVVLLVLGFTITVLISWSFEMTPEGLKRTAEITPGEVLARRAAKNRHCMVGAHCPRAGPHSAW